MMENKAQSIFGQLVSAVQYCHQRGIVHRVLQPQNVLSDARRNIKMEDFGLSTQFSNNKLSSPSYATPELFLGQNYDGPVVDTWSLAALL